ncbi:hypothetical protein ABW20_dc0104835 [Dactylellina cionopaga]|nr:hypothetical protein ABW20_dc0104835 [Dactylellina cionopaga]
MSGLEEAIPEHLITERSQPLQGPEDFKPKMPSYCARFGKEVEELVVLYLGVQAPLGVDMSAIVDDLRTCLDDPFVGFYDIGFFTDKSGYENTIFAAYWRSKEAFKKWSSNRPTGWWHKSIQLGDQIGVYWECYSPGIEDMESIFSHDDRQEGWSHLTDEISKPMNKHGYWGSAQDRIARSQTEDLKPKGRCRLVELELGLVQVEPQENLVVLRSAQDWTDTLDKERIFYKKGVEPVLMKGMKEIEDGLGLGCYFNRVVTLGEWESAKEKTYSVSTWHSMEELTAWVKTETHLAIFNAGIAHYQKAGANAQLRLHHEQMVIPAKNQEFFYFNCHKETGMLRAIHYR